MTTGAPVPNRRGAIGILEPQGVDLPPATDDDLGYLRRRRRVGEGSALGAANHYGFSG